MRKLMIAMLALAVVFGFAACDNSNSGSTSLMDKYVVALEVTGPDQYFVGDTLDEDAYTVTAVQNDGQKVTLAASDYAIESKVPSDASATEVIIGTVTYTGIYQGTIKVPEVDIKGTVYAVDGISVEGPASAVYYNTQDADDFKYDDYKVTAYALDTDGTTVLYQRELVAVTEYTVDFSTVEDSSNENVFKTGKYVLNVTGKGSTNPVNEDAKTSIQISVGLDSLASITLKANTKEAIEGVAKGQASDYVTPSYVMASGEVLDDVTDFATVSIVWASNTQTNFKLGTDETVTATVKIDGKDATIPVETAEITPIKDYITEFSFTTNSAVKVATSTLNVVVDTVLKTTGDDANLVVDPASIKWASGTGVSDKSAYTPTADELEAALKIVLADGSDATEFDTKGYENAKNIPISFHLVGLDRVGATTKCAATTVTAVTALN